MLPREVLLAACALIAATTFTYTITIAHARDIEDEVDNRVSRSDQPYAKALHRERRQSRNPNIFALLFQLIGETRRDIQRTFNEIGREIQGGLVDENEIKNMTAASKSEDSGASTTERARISRQQLVTILNRNWRGLTRLFNQEVDIAVDQSNKSAAEARKAFVESLAPFLQPATTTAKTTTTSRSG